MRTVATTIFLLCLLALASPARAQPVNVPRIGYLWGSGAGEQEKLMDALLAEHGYVDGRTVIITRRFADGDFSRLPELAADLLDQHVKVIIAQTTAAAQAAKAATSDIPIVVTSSGDAVGSGLVASLGRPGGNVTGVSFLGTELAIKQIQLIKEVLPGASRVGLVANGRLAPERIFFEAMGAPARERGVTMFFIDTRSVDDFPAAFDQLARLRADAAIVAPGGFYSDRRAEFLALARGYSIPALYFRREFPVDGGLMSYGASLTELYRLAVGQVDRILKGADPADLPVLQPTQFEFVVNLRTARQLGIEIPSVLLARADEVIE